MLACAFNELEVGDCGTDFDPQCPGGNVVSADGHGTAALRGCDDGRRLDPAGRLGRIGAHIVPPHSIEVASEIGDIPESAAQSCCGLELRIAFDWCLEIGSFPAENCLVFLDLLAVSSQLQA